MRSSRNGAVAAVGVVLGVAVGGPIVLDVLGGASLSVGTLDTVTFLFSFVSTPTEISMSIDPAVLWIGAVVGLVYALGRRYRRAHAPGGT
ncbi:hypothetical protein [Haloplanus halobius]|uniref:hypothetical protein n=1 Tax=Haloplanus halobius TaxID=2934938 RepID=UPI00200C4058|nr:hypothetical protein [Haloplanus sp. XH21]